jgi:hypothetical protein
MAPPKFDPTIPVQRRALLNHFRHKLRVDPARKSADEVSFTDEDALLRREKKSHQGFSLGTNLKGLATEALDQSYFDEVSQIVNLDSLNLRFPNKPTSLARAGQLPAAPPDGAMTPSEAR